MRSRYLLLTVLLPILLWLGCGGGSTPPPPPVVVTVFASAVTVAAGGTASFTASVTGTSNHNVTWQVNGTNSGNATVGTIDVNGQYTAPLVIPTPATVTVTAVSQANAAKTASAGITVTLVISPLAAALNVSDAVCIATQPFTTVGQGSAVIDWSVNGTPGGDPIFGTIDASGQYTSPLAIPDPPSFNVTATSQADSTVTASAGVSISAGGPGVNEAFQGVPIKLGTSGGNDLDQTSQFCCSGTLGALVTRNGTNFILSNNHVLARSGHAAVGENISQPGLVDTNCTTATHVADFTQAVTLNQGGTSAADAALAQVVSGQVDPTGAILQLGTISCGLAQPAPPASTTEVPTIGLFVAKSGRTSGLTCGTIAATNVMVQVQYENSCGSNSTFLVTYNNQVEIDSTTFSAPGDSGSLIVDATTAEPVALLFAGDPSSTIANPIQAVLAALPDTAKPPNIPTFVGGATHTVSACTGTFNANAQQLAAASASRPREEDLARAVSAKENHAVALMSDPAVIGVGVGAGDAPGEAAIIVFVDRDKPQPPIPATLDGVKTRVKSVGRFKAFEGPVCPSKSDMLRERISLH
jgi:hypothetical protein